MFDKDSEKIIKRSAKSMGITIGSKKSYDVFVKNEKFYSRVLVGGSLGLGESYMDGWWECNAIDDVVSKIMGANVDMSAESNFSLISIFFKNTLFNMQSKIRSRIVGKQHYDIGNELYKHMLDKNMNYTCAYWKNAKKFETSTG